jgi:hypothetical protein
MVGEQRLLEIPSHTVKDDIEIECEGVDWIYVHKDS